MASIAGQRIGEGWSRLTQSVSSAAGGGSASALEAGRSSGGGGNSTFVPFAGGGRTLGSGSEETQTRPSNPSRLVAGPSTSRTQLSLAPSSQRSQMDEDEALARQLQEQFLLEDRRSQG